MRTYLFLLITILIYTNINAQNCHNYKSAYNNFSHPQDDSLDVLSYNIDLNITDFANQHFTGVATIKIRAKQNNINNISLDLLNQATDSVLFNNQTASFSYNDSLLSIACLQTLNQNDTAEIKVYYSGGNKIDPSGWGGFYFTNSYAFNLGVGFRDVPHNYGRVWFPCIDSFTDRAFYSFKITVPDSYTAVCNGTLENITDNNNGTKTYFWQLHQSIPTYLASVAVDEYVAVTDTFQGLNGDIPIGIYTAPGNENNAQASFQKLKDVLNLFESRFGPYMWERVGYVGVQFNSGAMEHATNIAYPEAVIDGTLNNETLWAHELSHHWFGDLVTCSSAADMWLNEGWASYCESIFEEGIYGETAFKNYVRNNHYYVLRNAHSDDGDYYPVSGIPLNVTYGTTVYQKGADIVHNLRYYLGDDLFFNGVKHYLNVLKFNDASSYSLRDTLSVFTNTDLTAFFDNFVFRAGFPQYELDSFSVTQTGSQYNVKVYAKQKLYHRQDFADNNRLPISFVQNNWTFIDTVLEFNGQSGYMEYTLNFAPSDIWLDRNEHILDASVKQSKVFTAPVNFDFSLCDFKANIQNAGDSCLIKVIHNWVSADSLPQNGIFEDLILSPQHYWKINIMKAGNFSASGQFDYSRTLHDTLLRTYDEDSLVLLYRPNKKVSWQIVSDNAIGSGFSGYLQDDSLKQGEYCFAFRIRTATETGMVKSNKKQFLKVYPNPADKFVNIKSNYKGKAQLSILNIHGKELWHSSINKGDVFQYHFDPDIDSLIIVLHKDNKKIAVEKVIVMPN